MERADLELWKAREVARLLALVETERRYYEEMVAAIPVGLLVLSPDLSIVSSNRAARKIFGLRSGEPVRGRLDALLPNPVLDRVQDVLKTGTAQTGIPAETSLSGGRRLRIGIQVIRSWGDEGEQEVLLTIEDVTDFGARSTGSVAREQTIGGVPGAAELIGNLVAAIWVVEIPAMKFVFVNPHSRELLGFETNHWIETPDFWRERIHPDERQSVLASYQAAIQAGSGKRITCEYRSIGADRGIAWIHETARIVSDAAGHPRYVIGVSLDITERRLLEDQVVQANRVDAVGKVAARMAHDLNNILMIVSGYAEEVLHGLPPGSALRGDVREILMATDRITVLTNQMLAFTRYQTAPATTIELNAALQEMDHGLREALGAKISLENNLGREALAVRAESAQFFQVISAFVRHARETVPEGGRLAISLTRATITEGLCRAEATLQPGEYVVIHIEETGGTLDAAARAAMFESFLPGKEPEQESGPALARAYSLVRQWSGDIAVANASVGGSVFRIFLPLAAVEPSRARQVQAPETRAQTVLVAEDEPGIRALITKILRRQGYEVLEAENGKQALETGGEPGRRIDLLISDVVMPEMGGRELVDQLRASQPNLKVLYVSGYTDEPSIYAGDLPPGTAFLQKPFTLSALLDKVKEVLG
jgi:two-component system, cell cycle sensor histidine kinase and response regulator CckA